MVLWNEEFLLMNIAIVLEFNIKVLRIKFALSEAWILNTK